MTVAAITDPELRRRLALPDAEFTAMVVEFQRTLPSRDFTPDSLAHGLAYPWERPARSYVLEDGVVTELETLGLAERSAVLERYTSGRTPLLAIGSNGAPSVLSRKLGHFTEPADRDALVITGHLEGFEVGPSAHLALYGALPATIFPCPGAAARTAILWLTDAQFTQLAWTELSYWLGTLEAPFAADDPAFSVGAVEVFVSRFGAFCPDGEHVALAAVPARGRTVPALTQRQLVDRAAELVLGRGAHAEQLVAAAFADWGAVAPRIRERLWPCGRRFAASGWAPLF